MKPIRVLQVVGNMGAGGMETLIMNWYRKMDRNVIQFDFLVHSSKEGFYEKEIKQLGGKVYHFTILDDKNYFKYKDDLKKFFYEHKEYKVVHGHHIAFGPTYLKMAQRAGIPCRISHAHTASYSKSVRGYVKYIISRFFGKFANYHFACSDAAGKYMYGNKSEYTIINNGIDVNKFAYRKDIRIMKRKEMDVIDNYVILHVGRFSEVKNHVFLIEIFKKLHEIKPESILWLVGVGPLKASIEKKVSEYGLMDFVKFLNNRDDVNELLCAADIFIFPSLYEGLPLTLVEAQTSGLPIICSDTITKETKLTDDYYEVKLNGGVECWINEINEKIRNNERCFAYRKIKEAGYDNEDVVKKMMKFYLDRYNEI